MLAQAALTPAAMLMKAVESGLSVEGLEKLTDLYFKFEERRVEQAFNDAMRGFQEECPVILKGRRISFKTKKGSDFNSRYAPIEAIAEATRELRAKYGFSYTLYPTVENGQISVDCEVRHRDGHKVKHRFTVPAPTDHAISDQHGYAGAVTFCSRYAFCAAFGIVTGLPDNDGKEFTSKTIDAKQYAELTKLLDEAKPDPVKFLKYAGVEELSDLPQSDFARVRQALLDAIKAKKEKK